MDAKYIFRAASGIIRWPFKNCITHNRIRVRGIQKISINANMVSANRGIIKMDELCEIEEGTLLKANGGVLSVGAHVFVNRNCSIVSYEEISIGTRTTIGPNVCIYDHDHDYQNGGGFIKNKITIGENVWIGANVTILKGVSIGDNSVIAAGSVIYKDIPADTVAVCKKEITLKPFKKSGVEHEA